MDGEWWGKWWGWGVRERGSGGEGEVVGVGSVVDGGAVGLGSDGVGE